MTSEPFGRLRRIFNNQTGAAAIPAGFRAGGGAERVEDRPRGSGFRAAIMSLTFRQMSRAKENSMTRRVSMDYKLTPIKLACKDEEIDLVSLFLFTYGQLD